MNKGKLIIISGFSGVGKGTVVKKIMETYPDYQLSVSATTRSPRPGEVDGVHYHFVDNEKMEDMIKNDELLEYAGYVNNYYGTPRAFVDDNLAKGNNVILEIESVGARKVKEKMPEALMVFVLPPSAKELKNRLVGRQTEEASVIKKRLNKAKEETEAMEAYEYYVINDTVEACAENINRIVTNTNPSLPSDEKVLEIKNDILNFKEDE